MTIAHLPTTTDVLIVGGGPVGLALAVELGQRGISSVLVEKETEVGRQPRAKTTNVRTMEHMRRWGLAEHVRDAAPFGLDYPSNVLFATRLFGHKLALFENVSSGVKEENPLFSEPMQWIAQYHIERVLRDEVLRRPSVTLAMACEMLSFSQTPDSVTAILRQNGAEQTVHARYMVGCDGGRSFVRKELGYVMEGRSAYQAFTGLVVHAPGLSAANPQGPANMYWIVNEEQPGVIGPMDKGDLWFAMLPASGDETPDDETLKAKTRRLIGQDWPLELVCIDPWKAHALVANNYRKGRVFLAGDACHLHPPFGGFGLNMGIADAVDIGWKLAAMLQGWGGDGLLDSYMAERQPVHRKVVDEAVANMQVLTHDLVRADLEGDGTQCEAARAALGQDIKRTKEREFHTLGVVLGIAYDNSPINLDEAAARPTWHFAHYTPSAMPGALAPHLWLSPGHSLYDEFGQGFTLLVTGPGSEADIEALMKAASVRGLPLKLLAPDDARLGELYQAKLALIRPDQVVAWRGNTLPMSAEALLGRLVGQ